MVFSNDKITIATISMRTKESKAIQSIVSSAGTKKSLLPPPNNINNINNKPTMNNNSVQQPKARRPQESTTPKLTHFERCESNVLSKLKELRAYRVLHHSLHPKTSSEFEILEFYGDSVLYERVSAYFMTSRRFMSPHLLTTIRTNVVCNANLARVYDALQLSVLIDQAEAPQDFKAKADIIESIIGELAEASKTNLELSVQICTTLKHFLTFICYTGEVQYFLSLEKAKDPNNTQDTDSTRNRKKKGLKRNRPALAASTQTVTTNTALMITTEAGASQVAPAPNSPKQSTSTSSSPSSSPEHVADVHPAAVVALKTSPTTPPRSPTVFLAPPKRTLTPTIPHITEELTDDVVQQLDCSPTKAAALETEEVVDLPGLQAIIDFLKEESLESNSPPATRITLPPSPPPKRSSPVVSQYIKIAGKFYPMVGTAFDMWFA